jgi:hypothetical protein
MDTQERLDRLTGIVEALARGAAEHHDQLARLMNLPDERQQQMLEGRERD